MFLPKMIKMILEMCCTDDSKWEVCFSLIAFSCALHMLTVLNMSGSQDILAHLIKSPCEHNAVV